MNTKQTSTRPSPYKLIGSYRSELMGLATLWVMYNHAMLLGLTAGIEPFRYLQLAAHISVDIFFFLSGFGIYHSLLKNTVKDYFLKRLSRLLPVWGSFLLIHIIVDKAVFGLTFSLKEIIGFITFQGFAAKLGNQGNWYVYTIFLYYLIAPVPFSFLKESRHRFITCLVLTGICYTASYSYFGNRDLLITFIRIPAFIFGMYMASGADKESFGSSENAGRKRISDRITEGISQPFGSAGICICMIIILVFTAVHFLILKRFTADVLWGYGLWWHALIPMTVPLSLIISLVFSFFNKDRNIILKLLRLIGRASLEIFLIHLYIFKYWGEIMGILLQKSVPFRIGIFFLSILLGLIWHFLISAAGKAFSMLRKKES